MTAYRVPSRFDVREAGYAIAFWLALAGAGVLILLMLLVFGILGATASLAETCIASVYSSHDSDQNGTKTASGIRLNDNAMTAAHKHLPLRSHATATNLHNGRSVCVKITDRGPFVRGRCLDVTRGVARKLGISGLGKVKVEPGCR